MRACTLLPGSPVGRCCLGFGASSRGESKTHPAVCSHVHCGVLCTPTRVASKQWSCLVRDSKGMRCTCYVPIAVVFHTADVRKASKDRNTAVVLAARGLTLALAITSGWLPVATFGPLVVVAMVIEAVFCFSCHGNNTRTRHVRGRDERLRQHIKQPARKKKNEKKKNVTPKGAQ